MKSVSRFVSEFIDEDDNMESEFIIKTFEEVGARLDSQAYLHPICPVIDDSKISQQEC